MRPGHRRACAGICCLGLIVVLWASARASAQDKVASKLESYKKDLKELESSYRKLLQEAVKEAADAEKKLSDSEKRLVEELARLGAKEKEKRDRVKDELNQTRKDLLKIQESHKYFAAQVNGFRATLGWDKMEDRLGAIVKSPTPTLVDQLALPKGEGMVVDFVPSKTLAARVGLKQHDILLKIGGASVSSDIMAYKKIVNDMKTDGVEVTVLRHGKQVVLSANAATTPDVPLKKKEIPEK